MNSDTLFDLLLICVAFWCFYMSMSSIDNDRNEARLFCIKHNLEYVDWNNNAISCFDPNTHEVKAFKNEL